MDLLRNRYEVMLKISEGGSGAVWLAHDKSQMDGKVALKSIRPVVTNPTARATAIAQFRHEAYLLGSLDHPGIVAIHDSFGEGDTEYLVMEYLPHPSLKQIVQQNGRVSVRQVV